MNRYLKGALAYMRGGAFGIAALPVKGWSVDLRAGIFGGADLELDPGSLVEIGRNVRIRERASLKARRGARLALERNVYVGPGSILAARCEIRVGEGTLISPYVLIYDHDHKYTEQGVSEREYDCASVTIGKNCWIGANTVILKGASLGDNCVVAAGSIIRGSWPAGSRIVQKRHTEVL
ncbi:MAG: acyltransferase [Abditibacteriota bacterium]|nr:acyltransferase [Abditibacteriota bacterium]